MKILKIIPFCFTLFCFAQNLDFNDLESIPEAISASSSTTDGEYIYLTNGWTYQNNEVVLLSSIFKYDFSLPSWSTLNIDGIQPKRYLCSELINNKLYIFNGKTATSTNPTDNNDKMEIVDLNTNTLSFGAINPIPARNSGSAVLGNTIYVFGGSLPNNQYSNKLQTYNTENNTWTELNDMPVGRETTGEIINNKLYVIGGYNGNSLNRIDIYNITTNTWEEPFIMPFNVSANSTAVMSDFIFILGGYNNTGQVLLYNTTNSSLISIDNNMIPRRHSSAEFIFDNLFVFGGNQEYTTLVLNSAQNTSLIDFFNTEDISSLQKDIQIYPNPVGDYLKFTTNEIIEDIKYSIFNVDGSLIKSGRITNNSIELKKLNSGNYFIQLFFENTNQTLKFIKK